MKYAPLTVGLLFCLSASPVVSQEGDAALGARAFRACAACHSVEANRNMTGPSLADVWSRKAGTLSSFSRYSDAMKSSDVIWNEKRLNGYLENPAQFMPGNHMTFPGIPDEKVRKGIIAFLKQSDKTQAGSAADQRTAQSQIGGMSGMQRGVPNLKTVEASSRIKTISYCHDTFKVTTVDGKTRDFWERNLRFKTDSSEEGPDKDAPAIVNAGMMGDRASIIFSRGNQPLYCSRMLITEYVLDETELFLTEEMWMSNLSTTCSSLSALSVCAACSAGPVSSPMV
jgi:cytochrome c